MLACSYMRSNSRQQAVCTFATLASTGVLLLRYETFAADWRRGRIADFIVREPMVIGEPATIQPLLRFALQGFGSMCSLLHLALLGTKVWRELCVASQLTASLPCRP